MRRSLARLVFAAYPHASDRPADVLAFCGLLDRLGP
jgi:hypothetical protein